jgi:hypothetical protein
MTGKFNKEHRMARQVMSKHLKRELSIFEIVHHIDNNPANNGINNLKIMSREEHSSLHHAGRRR